MPRPTKIDKMIELAKATNNEELLKLAESMKKDKEKAKKTTKVKIPRKSKKVDKEENVPIFEQRRANGPVKFVGNQFHDDGTLAAQDKSFDKKYGKFYNVSDRTRPESKLIDVKCEHCPNRDKLSSKILRMKDGSPYYICVQCARKGLK